MDRPLLLAIVKRGEGGHLEVRTPRVGWWSGHPHAGEVVGPGSRIGELRVLERRHRLILPDGAAGRVVSVPERKIVPVEYAATLFRLDPLGREEQRALEHRHVEPGHPEDTGVPSGTWAVLAPTDGVFYRRPSPDAPSFVEVGSAVRAGQPVGLIEVMKTFNQILYGGPGLPEAVKVVEILAADGEEVAAGRPLLTVR